MSTSYLTATAIVIFACAIVLGAAIFYDWDEHRKLRYQMELLRQMVAEDHAWLSRNHVARALTTRYLAALARDWRARVHEDPVTFRRRIGLEPKR